VGFTRYDMSEDSKALLGRRQLHCIASGRLEDSARVKQFPRAERRNEASTLTAEEVLDLSDAPPFARGGWKSPMSAAWYGVAVRDHDKEQIR
jgi:hypothetical protein